MTHWIYNRLGVPVWASDSDLMAELDAYADEAIKGGRAVLTDGIRDAIREEHASARALYDSVTTGRF